MTSSYLSPEARQRRIERNRKRLGLDVPVEGETQPSALERAGAVGLGALEEVYSGVIQPVLEHPAVQTYFEYPRAGVTEAIQQYGEAREVMRERGVLAGLGHIAREQASTLADISWFPEEWGEQLDPSIETAMGVELDAAKQEFKERIGRDPTLIELYDLKAPIQDKHMPWLTERWDVGPFDMSKRFGLELGGEVAAAAVETLATLGTGLAARVPITAAKASKLAGKVGVKATVERAALQSVGQVLKGPLYVDKAIGRIMGTIITAPFRAVGLATKGVGRVSGLTTAAVATLARHTRRLLHAQGASADEAYRAVKQQADILADENNVERVTTSGFTDKSIDALESQDPWYGDNDMLIGISTPESSLPPTGVNAFARKSLDLVRETYEKTPFFAQDLQARLASSNIPLLRNLTKPLKTPRPTAEDRFYKVIVRDMGRKLAAWTDSFLNKQESSKNRAVEHTFFLMGLLEEQLPGLIVHSGKPLGKPINKKVQGLSKQADLVGGSTLDDVYKSDVPTNYKLGDQIFIDRGLLKSDGSPLTMKGWTPVANVRDTLKEQGGFRQVYASRAREFGLSGKIIEKINPVNGARETIAEDLSPMWSQVMERFELYKEPLSALTVKMPKGKDLQEVRTAYSIIEELAEIGARPEAADIVMKTPGVGVKPYVMYKKDANGVILPNREGKRGNPGQYPLSAIGRVKVDEPGYLLKGAEVEETIQFVQGAPRVHHEAYLSAAEAAMDGVLYPHPAYAIADRYHVVYERARIKAIGAAIRETAAGYGIKITKLEDLIASKATTALNSNLDGVITTLMRAISRQAEKARKGAPPVTPGDPFMASVPLMITRKMIADLKALGFSDEAIKRMTPADAWQRLGGVPDAVPDLGPRLAKDLTRSAPRFGDRTLAFERDLDRALYIIASPKTPRSAADARFLKFVMDNTGLDAVAARAAGREVLATIKAIARTADPGEALTVPSGSVAPLVKGPTVVPKAPFVRSAEALIEGINKLRHIDSQLIPVDTGDVPATVRNSLRGLEKQIEDWGKMVDKLHTGVPSAKRILTQTQFEKILDNLAEAKKNAEIRSTEIDTTMTTLTRFGFEGHYFPKVFADSILKTDEALRMKANPAKLVRVLAEVNGALRTMGATADMSAMGIQGIVPITNDALRRGGLTRFLPGGTAELNAYRQGDAMSSIRTSVEAMANNGREIMQEYWWRFDQSALEHGGLNSRQLAEQGLSIAQTGPDLYVSRIGDLPLMRKFNRAFTHYGNAMRATLANGEIHIQMVNGNMTLDQMITSGKVAEICAVMNIITGVGRRGFAGELGQFIFFAPRFMHARLKTVSLAARGMLPGDKTLMQQVAARYMSRYIGTASFLTIAINEAQGKETDLSPIIRDPSTGTWRANPNFMRIHMGGLDVSLFGPYDTLLRLLALPAFIALNVKETGFSAETLTRAFRSTISAPITASAIDLITGEDPIGRAIRDPEADLLSAEGIGSIIPTLLERSTPFAVNDIFTGRPGRPSVIERFATGVTEGDVGAVATAVTQGALQVVGGRSTYETPAETLRNMTEEIMGLGPDDPRIRELFPENMPEAEIQEIWESLEGSWWSKLIDEGKNFRMSLSLRSAMGLGKEPTPTWEMVADDVRYKLEEMVEEGRFTDIMSPEALSELKGRMEEAMGARSDDYSRYKVARDTLDADEERIIAEMEEGFAAGRDELTWEFRDPDTGEMLIERKDVPKGDTRAYLDAVNKMRGAFGRRRSNLVGPEGKYSGVTDLFEFANGTALGKLSTFDSDIYDAAEARYYQVLYEPTRDNGESLSSIVLADGTIDWDLRDQKLAIWAEQMKGQFPDLSAKEIQGFRVRVEKARKDKASPIAMVLLEMQDYIRDTVLDPVRAPGVTYYDIEKTEAEKIIKAYPRLATLKQYKEWKSASSKVRSERERQNPWLKTLRDRTNTMKRLLLGSNPQAAAVLLAMGSGPADAYNRRAAEVKAILKDHRSGRKNIQDMAQFLADVYNMEDLGQYR